MNCWEYWNCSEEIKLNCPVSKLNIGEECWTVEDAYKLNCSHDPDKKFTSCRECPFFIKQNS